MIQFIRKILPQANRVVLVGTAAADLLSLAYSLLAELGAQDQVSVLVVIALLNAKAGLFVKGWQQFEKAIYTNDLETRRDERALAQHEAVVASAQTVGGRPSTPRVNLPR